MTKLARAIVLGVGATLGSAAIAAPEEPITISVAAEVDGEVLQIRGTATVPDDAWIIYAVYSTANPKMRATDFARVKDGRFTTQVDISAWPTGEIVVDANFQTLLPGHEQPEAVIARYGLKGERMSGGDVVEGGDNYRAAVTSTSVIKTH